MPIPNGSLHRWWVEASAVNPGHVESLRPALVAFLALSPGREAAFAGTGFYRSHSDCRNLDLVATE